MSRLQPRSLWPLAAWLFTAGLLAAQDDAGETPSSGADKIAIAGVTAAPSPFNPSVTPLTVTASFQVRAALVMGGGQGGQLTHYVKAAFNVTDAGGAAVRALAAEALVSIPQSCQGNELIPVQVIVTWDGKDAQGLPAPDGTYTLTARGDLVKRRTTGTGEVQETFIDRSAAATTQAVLASAALDTTLTQVPPSPTRSTTATFAFTATIPGCTFQRSLDGGPFVAAASPETIAGLSDGAHVYQVRAVSPSGNVDPTPSSHAWVVDTFPPDTTITQKPPDPSNSKTAAFSFTSSEAGSTFERSLDGGPFMTATSPETVGNLADGAHSYRVRAIDMAGNVDPTPATYSWTVDTTPPQTMLTQTPPNPSNSKTATFAFASNEGGSTFERNLDGGPFAAVLSPETVQNLSEGDHIYQVRAIDKAGNVAPTPATWSWTVDTIPPETTLTQTPPNPSNSKTATFAFASNEAGSTFERSLDGGPFAAVVSPETLQNLSEGAHTYQVRAIDKAGNVAPTPAVCSWTVDTVTPVIALNPADGQTVNTATPLMVAAYSDALSGLNLASLAIVLDGTDVTSNFTVTAENASWTPAAPLADGPHTWRVTLRDKAGNEGAALAAFQVVVPVVPNPPVITTPNKKTNDNTPRIEGTSAAGVTIKMYKGETLLGTGTADDNGNWSVHATVVLPDGPHAIFATASNANGESKASNVVTVVVDTVPPPPPANLRYKVYDGVADLSWDASAAPDLLGYKIYRKGPGDADFIPLTPNSVVIGARYRDWGVERYKTYRYRVTAVDDALNEKHP
jgi:hypothetical protein